MSTIRTDSTTATDPDELLAHADWVRALARRVVRDEAAADDLAQETLVAALRRKPTRGSWRAWLRAVLRNFARQEAREAGRRAERERSRARAEHCGSTLEVLTGLAAHRSVVDAVEGLDEPCRTAIWLRYFEDLPPRKIAARLGVPVKTVDSRLHRGLAVLRARLKAEHGGDRAWSVALLPLCGFGRGLAGLPIGMMTTAGVTFMGTKAKILSAAAVVAVCFAVFWPQPTSSAPAPDAPRAERLDSRSAGLGDGAAADALAARTRVRLDGRDATPAGREIPMRALRGRVVDVEAAPLAGVAVVFEPGGGQDDVVLTSGPGGWFEGDVPDVAGRVAAADSDRYVTVLTGSVVPGSTVPPVVVVGRPIELAGVVVDAQGLPVSGVQVVGVPPEGFLTRFRDVLESTDPVRWRAWTAADGSFDLGTAPFIAGAMLRAEHPDFETAEVEVPPYTDRSIRIAVAAVAVQLAEIGGRVLLPDGRPAEAARVAVGLLTTVTDARGEFRLDLARTDSDASITAVLAGHLPATLSRPADGGGWPDYVELRLGGEPKSISGRVIGRDGHPLANADVWVAEPSMFGIINGLPVQTENLIGGARIPRANIGRPQPDYSGPTSGRLFDLTPMQREPTACWSWVRTGSDGRFEIGGLAERSYALKVMDRATLQVETTAEIAAGTHDVEVRMDVDGLHQKVRGRVLTLSGKPVADVRVRLTRRSFGAVVASGLGTLDVGIWTPGQAVRTGEDGTFEFAGVPKGGVFLHLIGEAILEHTRDVGPDDAREDIVIRLPARCHLKVESTAGADSAVVYDAEGNPIEILVQHGGSINVYDRIQLSAGTSRIVAVSELAASIGLFLDGEQLERVPLTLVPGEVTTVRR